MTKTLTLAEARKAAAKAAQDAQAARRRVAELEAAEQERLRLLGIDEPAEGVGYTYAALLLGNGAEVMAKRSPNRMWWWEHDFCGECKHRMGEWSDLLACVKPVRVVPLLPAVAAAVAAPGCAEDCACGDDCHR